MRCQCCNRNLSDFESRLKHPLTMEFLDICNKCLKDIPITPIEPTDVTADVGYDDEDDFEFIELEDDNYE